MRITAIFDHPLTRPGQVRREESGYFARLLEPFFPRAAGRAATPPSFTDALLAAPTDDPLLLAEWLRAER